MNHPTYKPLAVLCALALLAACAGQSAEPQDAAAEPHSRSRIKETARPAPAPAPAYAPAVAPMGLPAAEMAVMSAAPSMMKEVLPHPIENTERYGERKDNPVYAVVQEPVSTFSADVDTGSYSNVRRFLNSGSLPPANAVRSEEIVNYFDYGYAPPKDGRPFAVYTDAADSPWQPEAKLLRIAIKAKETAVADLPPANLVFLVDVSGSMNSENKLPLVKQTLRLLTERLRPQDKITLITYASGEQILLSGVSGKEKDRILAAVNGMKAGGSTAGESAIQAAYREAQKAFVKNGINRILLATDGDFNVGITDFDTLKSMVAEKRKSGISLTTLGFGTDNYNEHLMEQIADAGDGNYSYIDNRNEAKKVLQRQLSSTLVTVAQDVKIQVEFNPATVKEYRLVGYENRLLNQEDFNNDQADAGDIGAGHSVTALYEIIPAGKQGWLEPSRYQNKQPAKTEGGANEYAYVKLRYKLPGQSKSQLISHPVPAQSKPLAQAGQGFGLAVAAASYAQALQGGKYNAAFTWQDILKIARANSRPDPYGLNQEFVELVETAASLSAKTPQPQ